MMIIKKAAGLMSREEAQQLAEACNIYLVKEVRINTIMDEITTLGFFKDMDGAMDKLQDIMRVGKGYEKIELDPEKDLNRGLEFYTIDPQDYNWIIDTSQKIGKKLPILQLVQMGAEFDLDNLVALVPVPTGLKDMDPVFKPSIATRYMETQRKHYGNTSAVYTENAGDFMFRAGLGPYSCAVYDLQRGELFGSHNFGPVMKQVASVVSRFNLDTAFLANAEMLRVNNYFGSNELPTYSSVVVVDMSSIEERFNKAKALKLNLNYDFLDNYFSPELKKQMLRKIRRFINRRGRSKTGNFRDFVSQRDISVRFFPYIAIAIRHEAPLHSLERLETILKQLTELDIGEGDYSLPEEIEEAIIDKLGVGLLNYFENNGLTRPIQTLDGKANRFRSVVIRSIVDDAIASSLPGFSQPTGQQRGFTLEKSYVGMPQSLKDLTNLSTFNDLLRVKGESPTYIPLRKKQKMYLDALKDALGDMTEYLEGDEFKKFSDISDNPRFRFSAEQSFKEMGPYKFNYLIKINDDSDVDIGMAVIFEFKFTLPDFNSSSSPNLTLEEVDVEKYILKTTQSRYTVDINKIEDLNLEIADAIRRVFEPRNFFSNPELLQQRGPAEEGQKEGPRITNPSLTAKGLLANIFKEQAAKPTSIVIQDLVIDNLTGRMMGILFYPGITGEGFYLSVDDRKSGLVRTRPEKGEIFVVCSGGVSYKNEAINIGESVCSYANSKSDFESSMDSAIPAFLLAGGAVGEPDIGSITYGRNMSKPRDVANIEISRGNTIKLRYYLVSDTQSHDGSFGSHPSINLDNESINSIVRFARNTFSYTDATTEMDSILLVCKLDAYQQTLSFSLDVSYIDTDGDTTAPSRDIGYYYGTFDNGEIKLESDVNFDLFSDPEFMEKIKSELKSSIEEKKNNIVEYIKNNKNEVISKIRRKAYGYELGHTSNIGIDYAKRKFRGKTNE